MISKQITYIFLQIAVLFDFKNAECDASPPVAFYAGKFIYNIIFFLYCNM